jgi:hypothetical protein
MRQFFYSVIATGVLSVLGVTSTTSAQGEGDLCRDVLTNPIFNETNVREAKRVTSYVRRHACSTEWRNATDLRNAATSAGLSYEKFLQSALNISYSSNMTDESVRSHYRNYCNDDTAIDGEEGNVVRNSREVGFAASAWESCMTKARSPSMKVKSIVQSDSTQIAITLYKNTDVPTPFIWNRLSVLGGEGSNGSKRLHCRFSGTRNIHNPKQSFTCFFRGSETFFVNVSSNWGTFEPVRIEAGRDLTAENQGLKEDLSKAVDRSVSLQNQLAAERVAKESAESRLKSMSVAVRLDADFDGQPTGDVTVEATCPTERPIAIGGACKSGNSHEHNTDAYNLPISAQGIVEGGGGYRCSYAKKENFRENNVLVATAACIAR